MSGACVFTPKPLPVDRDALLAKAKNDALKLLSFRARSSSELLKRLREKGYDTSVSEEVLTLFKKQRLINDEAFVEEFVRSRSLHGASGRRRLERDLKTKGLAPALISDALAKVSPEEEARQATEIAIRRQATFKSLPQAKQKQRLFGFLARRGFSTDSINVAFRKVFSTAIEQE